MVTKITKKFHPTSLFLPETLKKHEKMNKKKFAKKIISCRANRIATQLCKGKESDYVLKKHPAHIVEYVGQVVGSVRARIMYM